VQVIQLDEMALNLDTSIQGGGRPSHVPTTSAVPDSGESAPKGGKKVTVIHGINFAGEALPPYIQFPTDAKKVENYKMRPEALQNFPQICGCFGSVKNNPLMLALG
jgi:hypothetical protein